MTAEELAKALGSNAKLVVHVVNASNEIEIAARNLLYALDNGFLNYKPDTVESAFVSSLRAALASAKEK